jgi:hypothetical protein
MWFSNSKVKIPVSTVHRNVEQQAHSSCNTKKSIGHRQEHNPSQTSSPVAQGGLHHHTRLHNFGTVEIGKQEIFWSSIFSSSSLHTTLRHEAKTTMTSLMGLSYWSRLLVQM